MNKYNETYLYKIGDYHTDNIYELLDDEIFSIISPSDKVILKPNWVHQSHLSKPNDWEYVITHPDILTAVLIKVLNLLNEQGEIIICDSPETDTDFEKLLSRYPVDLWYAKAKEKGIQLTIIDLRDHLWKKEDGIIVQRSKLPGDTRGNADINLQADKSEFYNDKKSPRGYYGADFNINETNKAHDGFNNIYRVSKSVIEADVFINIPKLKTHKKGGITCCLKNLVGINTYKNYLPHYSEGSVGESGDQFPKENINSKIEGPLLAFLKQHFLVYPLFAKLFKPFKKFGRLIFGDTNVIIRSGNWYGNDTLWRMVLDLNKVLFYAEINGSMRTPDIIHAKKYIGIVDGITGGDGNGPLYPDPVHSGFLITGTNPVAIDATCARIIGFDPLKIPSIKNAFTVSQYPICDFTINEIIIHFNSNKYTLSEFPENNVCKFKPHYGWAGHIEFDY